MLRILPEVPSYVALGRQLGLAVSWWGRDDQPIDLAPTDALELLGDAPMHRCSLILRHGELAEAN
jgi:hypothetical protein